MRSRTLLVAAALGALAWGAAPRAGEEDERLRPYREQAAYMRQSLVHLQREAAMAPAALSEVWRKRLAAAEEALALAGKALEAAAAGQPDAAEFLRRAQEAQQWGHFLDQWRHAETRILQMRQQEEAGETPEEKELRAKEAELHRQVAELYAAAAAGARLGPEAQSEVQRRAAAVNHQVQMLWQVRSVLLEKRNFQRQRDAEQDAEVKALYAEVLGLLDALEAAARRLAEVPREGGGAAQELYQEQHRLQEKVRAWVRRREALAGEKRFARELAEAPAAVRPLLEEAMRCRRQAAALRQEQEAMDDEGEARRLEGRADALDERAEALGEIAEARGEFAEIEKEAAPFREDPRVRALLARLAALLEAGEKLRREVLELRVAAIELEARADAREEELEAAGDGLDELRDEVEEALEDARERKERGGDPGEPARAGEVHGQVADQVRVFRQRLAGTAALAPAQARTLSAVLDEALRLAGEGKARAEAAAPDQARKAFEQAHGLLRLAEKLDGGWALRVRVEQALAALPADRKAGAEKDVEAYRKSAEAAAELAVAAERAVAGGAAAENVLESFEKSARAEAAARQAGTRLLRDLAPAPPEAGRGAAPPPPPDEPEVF